MNTKDGFNISAFRMLLSVVAVAIMLPMVYDLSDMSFYVTVCVYVLGKFIDLVAKIMERQRLLFLIVYLMGIIVGMLAVGMCFFAFANTYLSDFNITFEFNFVLLCMTTAFCCIDIIDFVWCICRLGYTKLKLKQFN